MKEISVFNGTCKVGIERNRRSWWEEVWFIREWTKEKVNMRLLPETAKCVCCTHIHSTAGDGLRCYHPDSPKGPENQMTHDETMVLVCPNWYLLGWEPPYIPS